ncbi:heterodisulfide reductase subunit A [Clostridia bacterium]|nr:heterodisulfide reductase subunit A [Clostridia bacterium]
MSAYKLDLTGLRANVTALLEKYTLIAPARIDGKLDYLEITDAEQIVLTNELPYKSPKDVVLPRVERLIRFADGTAAEAQEIKPILLLGVKPCDAQALRVLDEVFAGDRGRFKDNFYINRRTALTIIGAGCTEAKPGCFCFARGIDKAFSSECDGFLHFDEDGFVFEPLSDKGAGLFFGTETAAPMRTQKPEENLALHCGEDEVFSVMPWDIYAEGCIGCGTCTYICPTCHCFVLRDAEDKGSVDRTRVWDSCMYPNFTLHAGGHNPRAQKKDRYRQRVLHKYLYIPENYGMVSCTGCGRCIRSCPGGINIMNTVYDIKERLEDSRK